MASLLSASAWAATGDITGLSVETNGFQVLVYVSGLSSNGIHNLGLTTGPWLNSPAGRRVYMRNGMESLRIPVSSPGFDSSLAPVTRLRWVTATVQARHSGTNSADIDEVYDGTTIRLKYFLDWPIYSGDTIGQAQIKAGLYTQGTASAASTSLTPTNGSTITYHKPIANWTWPGYNRELGPDMYLRAFGASPFAQEGLPLAGINFIVSDEAGVTITNKANFGFDPILSTLDPHRTAEFWAAIPLSGFGVTNSLRCNFMAYPWIGRTNEILDTRSQPWVTPHFYPTTISNLCDRTGVYCDQIAVVSLAGNDSNGRATNVAPASVNSSHYFLSIAGAANAIANTNNWKNGHNDAGGGKIYVRAGVTNWTGGTVSGNATNIPKAWVEILPYPGDSVVLTNRATSQDISERVKFDGTGGTMTWGFVGTGVPFNNIQALWGNNITINSTATAFWQGSAQVNIGYLTHSKVEYCTQGLALFPGSTTYWALLRGNNLNGLDHAINYTTALSNYKSATNGTSYTLRTSSVTYSADYSILYNNKFMSFGGSSDCAVMGATLTVTNGMLIAQNVFEYIASNVNPNLVFVATTQNVPSSNIMFMHNTVVGKRSGKVYNDTGTNGTSKWCWSWNNIDEIPGFKSDTFPSGGANGLRTGNWQYQFGVGCFGNVYPNRSIDQAAGQFPPDFPGFGSWFGSNLVNETNVLSWPQYYTDKGYTNNGTAAGSGDYRLRTTSPFISINSAAGEYILKYDIDGNPRGMGSPPGAYATAMQPAAGLRSP